MSRSDKIRAVAQQAHDNGDCVCCLPDEMVEFERAKQDTITITISQNEAVWWARRDPRTGNFFERKVSEACRAALEGER